MRDACYRRQGQDSELFCLIGVQLYYPVGFCAAQVNLVLEYCDWGCLRDALDAGAFFSGGSLNYAAILDTAADVAKAMLHLHCNQVGVEKQKVL